MQEIDSMLLGINIRKARKEKGITLEELAKGICSTGKMSNIENGISVVNKEMIELIAEKLEMTSSDLISVLSEDQKHLSHSLETIEQLIGLSMYKDAQRHLTSLIENNEKKVKETKIFQTQIAYLEGILLKQQAAFYPATISFYKVLSIPISSQKDVVFRAKAHQNLGELHSYYNENTKAIEHIEKGVDELRSINLDVPWKFYYNLTILYLYLNNPLKADIYFRMIRKQDGYIGYLESLLHLMSGNYNIGMNKLKLNKQELLEERDQETLSRSLIAFMYFSSFSPTEHKDTLYQTILPFVEQEILSLDYETSLQKGLSVKLLVCIILFAIKNKNVVDANKYLEYLIEFERKYSFFELNYFPYLLRALIEKETENPNKELIKDNLIKAKKFMEKQNITNTHYFNVLIELSLLNNEKGTYASQAINFIGTTFNLSNIDIIERDILLPPLKSIEL